MKIKCKMASIIIGIFILTGFAFTQDSFPVLKGPYLGQAIPGKSPKIFAAGIISFGFHENGIVFSPDGKYLFYSSFKKPDPAVFSNKSYRELIDLYRHPQNGYAALYWVDAGIIDDLIK
jgi:hypothetical protein